MHFIKRLIPLLYFGLFALASCYKIGVLLRSYNFNLVQNLELARTVFISLFFYLLVFSYIMRSDAKVKAVGILERWLPLFVTVAVPFFFGTMLKKKGLPYLPLYFFGLLLTIYGWILAIRALWFLKYSFSIMAEVRDLVTDGPYLYVRHPLYLAEIFMVAGLTAMVATLEVFVGFVIFIILQVIRAEIEEKKLFSAYENEFLDYKQSTGFFFPRWFGKKNDLRQTLSFLKEEN